MIGSVGWVIRIPALGNQLHWAHVGLIHRATTALTSRVPFRTAEDPMLNNEDLVLLLFFASSILLATTLAFATLWIRARERLLRARIEPSKQIESAAADVQHLVHAVDSIAIEVERISEAQRFTTQLLNERTQPPASSAKRGLLPEHVITPH
jgi:hypothetical protein